MQAEIRTLQKLFQLPVRYEIPTFQRPYVWTQEQQWEPLWNDVRNTAEEFMERLSALGHVASAAQAEAATKGHFMGAVVFQQQSTATGELETRHVIDGQQRITTLQLLLDAAQEVFEHGGFEPQATQLRHHVLNDSFYGVVDPDKRFKVWPTLGDRDAFRAAMSNDHVIEGYEDSAIVQAHEFFKLQIHQWLDTHPESAHERATALYTALLGLLKLVVIDLQANEDPNIIFETLNARGTPLEESDLIKNWLLGRAKTEGFEFDTFHKLYWQEFAEGWWREDVQQGRLYRPRIDLFLYYWLTMRTSWDIQSDKIFVRFQDYANTSPGTVSDLASDIKKISASYSVIESVKDTSHEGRFLTRWHMTQAGVATPVVLWLFANKQEIGSEVFLHAISAIESYLIRRMVCRLTTKDYNHLFLELMRQLKDAEPRTAGEIVSGYLTGQTSESRIWPMDSQVIEAFTLLPLYNLLTRGRLRLILETVENTLHSPKSEGVFTHTSNLTIEHVMPQSWEQHWPLANPDDAEAVDTRRRLVQTIGNLTLVSGKLNPVLSNGAWKTKRIALSDHSILYLNKQLVNKDTWNETSIQERSRFLAQLAAQCWPRPNPS